MSRQSVVSHAVRIIGAVPRLWNDTIAAHREDVHTAILDATAALATEQGLLSVTMSQIAERSGIGRATLYKYFPDVATILLAWHHRQIAAHLAHLAQICDRSGPPLNRLRAVLEAYALIRHEHHDPDLAAVLHRGTHLGHAHDQLTELLRGLIAEAAHAKTVRDDVEPTELATYCVHALGAAATLPSAAAVRRLVGIIASGLVPAKVGLSS